jgi:hypothetical protein
MTWEGMVMCLQGIKNLSYERVRMTQLFLLIYKNKLMLSTQKSTNLYSSQHI